MPHPLLLADMSLGLLDVTALVLLLLLQALAEAQTTQSSDHYSRNTVTYDVVNVQEYTSPGGRLYTSTSTYKKAPEITYRRISTIRVLTTTNDQGQPQTLAEVTTEFEPASMTGAVATGTGCDGATCTQTTLSTIRTIGSPWKSSGYVSPPSASPTAYGPPNLYPDAVMRIFFGVISAFLALLIGGFLFSSWRRRRKTPFQATARNHGSENKASAPPSETARALYLKPELHGAERALYEMDGRHALPEADGGAKLAGELEDKQAASVARDRERRKELPEEKSNVGST